MNAPCTMGPRLAAKERITAQHAWTAFWQEPDQTQCLSGATEIQRILTDHWAAFAVSLPPASASLISVAGTGRWRGRSHLHEKTRTSRVSISQ